MRILTCYRVATLAATVLALLGFPGQSEAQDELPPAEVQKCGYQPSRELVVSPGGALRWIGLLGDRRFLHSYRPVRSVAVSPDGKSVLSGGNDGRIVIWEAQSGFQKRVLEGHRLGVSAMAMTPDGKRVVSGGRDGTVRIWDADTGAALKILEANRLWLHDIAVEPNGRWLVSAGEDPSLTIWDVRTGDKLRDLEGHRNEATCVDVSWDGRYVVSGDGFGWLMVWDASSGRELRRVRATLEGIDAIACGSRGSWFVVGTFDGELSVWDSATLTRIRVLKHARAHARNRPNRYIGTIPGGISGLSSVPNSTWVVAAIRGGRLAVWDTETGAELKTSFHSLCSPNAVAVSPGGSWFVAGGGDGSVRSWDMETGKELICPRGHPCGVTAVAIGDDDRVVVTAGRYLGRMRIWDSQSRRQLRSLAHLPRHSSGGTLEMTPGGKVVGYFDFHGDLRLWDVKAERPLGCVEADWFGRTTVALDAQAETVAFGKEDGVLCIVDRGRGGKAHTVAAHGAGIFVVALNGDGSRVVSGAGDGTVKVWNAETGNLVTTLQGHEGRTTLATISPDGKWVASAGFGPDVRISDLTGKTPSRLLRGHDQQALGLAFSVDGQWLVSVGGRRSLSVYEVCTGALVDRIPIDSSPHCVSFGKELIAVGCIDWTVHLYRFRCKETPRKRPADGR
jgi:WD40 repeat protein